MPKILINEKDITSPGTPDSYSNFTVLVVGFAGRDPVLTADATDDVEADAIQPDSNGVYEFTSAQAFKDTIGLLPPKKKVGKGDTTVFHYGNQMAYELLNIGYPIIYKPIKTVDELTNENTWEIFKDKASYDFRFVTHGLLESSSVSDETAYNELVSKMDVVETAQKELEKIHNAVVEELKHEPNLDILEEYDLLNIKYQELIDGEDEEIGSIFVQQTGANKGQSYSEYRIAVEGVKDDYTTLAAEMKELIDGGITTAMINQANACIANLAKYSSESSSEGLAGRGDCIALIEVDEKKYLSKSAQNPIDPIINAINAMGQIDSANGKYCAMTVPSVHYKMAIDKEKPNEFENNVKFPGAFHYLACFMNSLNLGFAEWYAAAGYTRGVASYIIDHTSVKLGEIAINALEPRYYVNQKQEPKFACNVIANFRGSHYLWGNRTAHPLGRKGSLTNGDLVASSFLNIRQLCCTIKKQLYVACRTFTFDPNSDTLWVNFCNAIRPTLEAMKADQGIRDYKILKVFTDKKATLKAKIRIIPIEAVEDFDLEVSLEDSFGETTAVVTE